MLPLPTYFDDFLSCIRPTQTQRDNYKNGHRVLRERLTADDLLKACIVATFLQGSYRRATAVRPNDASRPDVDVVVVTNISTETTPAAAMTQFAPFLEKHYAGNYKLNDRSYEITLDYVKLDLVITAKPSPEDEGLLKSAILLDDDDIETGAVLLAKTASDPSWKPHPLLIPDRRVSQWQETHPLAQIRWTWAKNAACHGHYVNVVKAIKWWRKVCHTSPPYPKGYPLEHIIGSCCPDGITSVAEGVTLTLEEIARRFAWNAAIKSTPVLKDHGVDQNVLHRVSGEDFSAFHAQVAEAAPIARGALDETSKRRATEKWRRLFGEKFPLADEDGDQPSGGPGGGFTPRKSGSTIGGGRYG